MKKTILSMLMMLTSSFAIASTSTGEISANYFHNHFTMLEIGGDAALSIYRNLDIPQREDVNQAGESTGTYSKISTDGRMACTVRQTTYKCTITLDSSSGAINSTWKK
jgi:hypothetical protein